MKEVDQQEAREEIRYFVWSGFYDPDEMADILCNEYFEPGTLQETWVVAEIAKELEKKHSEEGSWSSPTDCERLDRVFKELESRHIISLQNAGYTQSEGMEDMSQVWDEAGAEDSDIVGYCFYHGQDLERAVAGDGLLLAFGDILGTDDRGVEVGNIIVEVLEINDFKVDWDGTIAKRIGIPEIRWQKRTKKP